MSKKPKFSEKDAFALAAELFYQPGLSLRELSDIFQCSTANIKCMVRLLKQGNVMHGRLGSSSMWLNLASLPNLSHAFCNVVVTVERDVEQLKMMAQSRPQSYDAAKDLLMQLCNELPLTDGYRGRIIVEAGHMLLGIGKLFGTLFNLLLIVHGASNGDLFNFVIHGVNMTKGVRSSQTLMVPYTYTNRQSMPDQTVLGRSCK